MSVSPVSQPQTKRGRSNDDRRGIGDEQAAEFQAALRKRQRLRGRRTDEPSPEGQGAAPALWQLALGSPNRFDAIDGDVSARGARTPAPAAAVPDAAPLPAGIEPRGRASGEPLHLRFTQGDWAGMELQAALHAGQIVVTLRPVNRQQHRRLLEAKTSLCEHVTSETGETIKLEIADATR